MDENSGARVLDLTEMEEIGGYLGGTNPGMQLQSSSGKKYYAKCPLVNSAQVWTEVLAGRLYELAGIAAAKTHAGVDQDMNLWLLSEWVDHETDVLERLEEPSSPWVLEAMRGFAVDAWLGNYDVVGDIYTNLVTVEDQPFRLDNGASLSYTATGKYKHWWSDEVTDLRDMRFGADYSWAYESAVELFGKMDDDQVEWSVWQTLFPVDERSIETVVDEFGRLLPKDTLARLLTRKRYIESEILL